MNNLADNPEYREVVARLQKQLLAEMKATGDPRLIDEGRFFEDVSKFDGN